MHPKWVAAISPFRECGAAQFKGLFRGNPHRRKILDRILTIALDRRRYLKYLTALFIYIRTNFPESSSLKTSHHRDVNMDQCRSERPLTGMLEE